MRKDNKVLQEKKAKAKGAFMGLYDLTTFVGLGAITYMLFFEGDMILKYMSAVSFVKFLEIADKRFLK